MTKPLLFFIRKLAVHRRTLIIGVFLSLTLAMASIALLTLSGWFISAAALAGLTTATAIAFNYFIPASLVRFLALIRILSRYTDRVINHDYTFKILTQLRVWFYEKLIPLSPANLLSTRSGDLLNRLVHDIETLDHLYLNFLSPFLIALLTISAGAIFIAYFSKTLSLVIFGITVFVVLIMTFLSQYYASQIGKKIQQTQTVLRIQMVDTLQGFVDLLLFKTTENRDRLLDKPQQQLLTHQKKLARLKAGVISAMSLLSGITIWMILWLGIPFVDDHVFNGAILAMIIFLSFALYEQLLLLPLACLSLGQTKEAANRVWMIATQKPSIIFPSQSESTQNHEISFQQVTFHYPDRTQTVFENFSLHIPVKTKIAITGPSGSGKTSLLNLLARIFDPQCGDIFIGNMSVKLFSENHLRSTISYVTQQVHIFNASVRDNITLFQSHIEDEVIWYWLEKMALADDIRKLPDRLNTQMGEFGKNFSGGQIRRIGIARGLFAHTPILLLDEPSTGLNDALTEHIVKNCQQDFENKVVIIATHDPILLDYFVEYPICSINPVPAG